MGMDVDWLTADQAITELRKLLSNQPHGEREIIADEIIDFVEKMKEKYK